MDYLKGLGQVVYKVVKPILLPLAGAVALGAGWIWFSLLLSGGGG